MIQQGDRFTFLDLQQSVREICAYNMRTYINKKQSDTFVVTGNSAIIPYKYTPQEFATICIQAYGDIQSSAKHLDQQLRDKGFKTTHRFSYKYNNGGLTPEQIVHDAYCLDWFHSLYQTAVPITKYEDQYLTALGDAFRLSYYYAQYLFTQNRRVCGNLAQALKQPNTSQWEQIIGALLGIGFQFHPADVYEYATNFISPNITQKERKARRAEQQTFKDAMMTDYGIDTGCLVLSQESREKLRKIATHTDTPYYIQVIKNLVLSHNR